MKLRLIVGGAVIGGMTALGAGVLGTAAYAGVGQVTSCTSASAPAAGAGATSQTLPDGGTLSTWGGAAGGGVLLQGPHGWIDASGSPTSGGGISGYSTDQGNLNGSLSASSSGVASCIAVGGQGVAVSAP